MEINQNFSTLLECIENENQSSFCKELYFINDLAKLGDLDQIALIKSSCKSSMPIFLEQLCINGIDSKLTTEKGENLLHLAFNEGNERAACFLALWGVPLNFTDDENNSPLLMALKKNFNEFAAFLIENEEDTNCMDNEGNTALNTVIRNSNVDLVKALLRFGADPNIEDKELENAFDIANDTENQDIIRLLSNWKEDNEEDVSKVSGQIEEDDSVTKVKGKRGKFSQFLNNVNEQTVNVLDDEIVIDANEEKDDDEDEGVHNRREFRFIHEVEDIFKKTVVKGKVEEDGEVNRVKGHKEKRNNAKKSFLTPADVFDTDEKDEGKANTEIITEEKVEVQGGTEKIQKNGMDGSGSTEKMESHWGRSKLEQVEEEEEAALKDIDAKNTKGQTRLMASSNKGDLEKVAVYIELGAKINTKDYSGKTALIYACEKNRENVVEILLSKGAKPDIRTKSLKTALIVSIQKERVGIVDILLKNGSNPNISVKGETALMMAAKLGNREIVDIILNSGVDPKVTDFKGKTAARHAQNKGFYDLSKYLKQFRRIKKLTK